jgi:mannitol/fructose-specific phosphotransferase system IIA component (Ntr-type)
MKLSEYLDRQCVAILSADTKAAALDEMAALLADADVGVDHTTLLEAVHQREKLMSTGIGNALAIPHVRLKPVPRAAMAVGVAPAGIADYESLDGKPVQVIVMIAAPQGQHDTYVKLLAMVADVVKQEDLRTAILQAEDAETVHDVLTGARRR